jgi:uncharacterized integral membrane protein
MKYLYIALIVAFTAMVLLFKVQNLEQVTVSLFSSSMTLSVSTLILLVYILGALSGGMLYSLLKKWVGKAREPA